MADNIDNLIIEHLKALRNELRDTRNAIQADLRDIKARLSSLVSHQAATHFDSARQSVRLDDLDLRIERVERRLELAVEST
jgi:hypothetical protein